MSIPSPLWSLPLGQVPTTDVPATGAAPAPAAPAAQAPAAPTQTEQAPQTTVGPAAPASGTTGTTQTNTTQPQDKLPERKPGFDFPSMLMLGAVVVVFYFILFRGPRKQEKQRKEMVAQIKKGDRVMTIGGLVARVVSIDNDEVVLKIDESANVKATYKKSSIQQVLTPGDEKTK